MRLKSQHITTIIIITALSLQLYGQKVGLVLSGGGARGVTHIGVLKALEENDIPIDYITGSSMGAFIGGLYSAGYTPEEIEKLITSDEMQTWISGKIESKYKYYFKEPDPNASWQIFKIVYDSVFKASLPASIISPFKMDFGFMELFSGSSAAAGYDFDCLYIPFRCVASDIASNKPIVLKNGDVGKSIRASITFPFYIKPIKINDKLLFDGGMYNNFPIDILEEEFSPDIIIGSKAASNYLPPEEFDLLSQIQSMVMINTDYNVDTTYGVLIEPGLKSVDFTDYRYTKAFIDSGYTATISKIAEIKRLINRKKNEEDRIKERKAFTEKIPEIKIGGVKTIGVSKEQDIYIKRVLRKKKFLKKESDSIGRVTITLEELKPEFFKLIADKNIEYIFPALEYNSATRDYDLVLDIKKSNKIEAELGGLVSSSAINEIFFQMQYKHWRRNALSFTGNAYLGRFHNSGHAGVRMDFPGAMPFFLETTYTLNGWNYFKTSTYFFEDEKPSYLLQSDSYWKFDIGIPVSRYGKLVGRFSSGRKKDEYYQTNQFSRLDTTDKTTFDFYSPGVFIELNSLNRKQYASKGVMLRLCGRFVSGQEKNLPGSTTADTLETKKYHNWYQLRFIYDNYFETFGPLKLGFYGQAAISNQPFFNNYTSTILSAPAFEPIPESKTLFLSEFRAHNFVAIGIKFIFNLYKNLDFRAEGYGFQPFQAILKTEDNKATYGKEFSNRYYIASNCLVYHAPFGPVSMCLNYYDQAEEPFSFNINIGFLIFNKRPFE
ncbi:MAG: patatin-like phospholipase family protein [Bacteroidales bacterium]|nr:patatin-like phospholipase family protein [Bacteroidales bacterium]